MENAQNSAHLENTYRHRLPTDLAAALRAARHERGLGLRETARKAGISPGYFHMIEHGDRCPSRAVAEDLIGALDLDHVLAEWLLDVARPNAGRSWQADGRE
jgi:transcriptional regulator with XRE-family HTH domain